MARASQDAAAGAEARRLFVFSGGFLTQPRIRRILTLSGYDVHLGKPAGPEDRIGVWGRSPTAPRGEAVGGWTGAPVVRVEDAFLRSVRPGRDGGAPPLGLLIDDLGVHFDSSKASRLERILAADPLDDGAILARARDGIERLKAAHLSKYNAFDPGLAVPEPGYVLVIDQTQGDSSIEWGGASASTFREMLVFAQEEHPGARIVIKTHPETVAGRRPGHYGEGHAHGRISLLDAPVSPWKLMEGAVGVYTVSSQMGFEAILAGHRPRVFGQPFYAGWGLTADENPVARRERKLTRAQLFAAAMILAPAWYDPCRDRLCSFEEAVDQLEAEVRAFREDRGGHVAVGMRLWKRPQLQKVFGRERPVIFENDPARAVAKARAGGRGLLVWGAADAGVSAAAGEVPLCRVEDGFLRSRGLGAELVPPLSLVADPVGIYYDPARESAFERLVAAGPPPGGEQRAERLIARIARAGLTKYNLDPEPLPELPAGHRILVPGQVEDDASVRLGAGREHTNLALLERVRAENPGAVVVYKPHPDVEAGLRTGAVPAEAAGRLADVIARRASPATLIEHVDEVWTITSTLGFEALLRGKPVTCLGMPFYAGWGLTRDLFPEPPRRRARPTLAALAHAALIAYPRYVDPVTGLPCPAEVIVDRIARHQIPAAGPASRLLSRLQGLFASHASLWRKGGAS
ncbi:capsular polysaccharide biosynthesis protein [Albidovulum sp.]|uniref:capsular polysaccharide biosynthesis protein n=1 Tax=Albidovulum sp. TaxID=1872424 RepID=UPI0039B9B8CF